MNTHTLSPQIILGTAGHIDHGKTTLVKALTGIDCDRLKEEKARGITIDLGFASLGLPSGQRLGIVDVPGHERFIKNMLAGATGIDMVALIIAADEGVMPQTQEHLDICELLNIKHSIVVLTKIDLVDEEWLSLVTDDIERLLKETSLKKAPIIPVSSTTGQGITALISTLDDLCKKVAARPSDGLFRLPVDRVFTMKGFGTVVTGALISGKICVGEKVLLYPSGTESKVRGIQVHNASVECASAGLRTAVNLHGLEKSSIARGDVVAHPGTLHATYMADVLFKYLKSAPRPLKNRAKIRFYTGTSEALGHVVLLDRQELFPGDETILQCRFKSPLVLVKNDCFVIRSLSPVSTIGGGHIIDPIPLKHKQENTSAETIKAIADNDPEKNLFYHLKKSSYKGVTFSELLVVTGQTENVLNKLLDRALSTKKTLLIDRENKRYVHAESVEILKALVKKILARYHEIHPLRGGMPSEELRSQLPSRVSARLSYVTIETMAGEGAVIQEKETIRLSSHRVSLEKDLFQIGKRLENAYEKAGLEPPYFKDLLKKEEASASFDATEVLNHLISQGVVLKIKEGLYFHCKAIDKLKNNLVEYLKAHNEITPQQFKEIAGVSRKYAIPLLEYFDALKLTIRIGDSRRLR
ncbi:MAG: selenocysteine-specific translation elongation factor [Pseudomonadota bacterium]